VPTLAVTLLDARLETAVGPEATLNVFSEGSTANKLADEREEPSEGHPVPVPAMVVPDAEKVSGAPTVSVPTAAEKELAAALVTGTGYRYVVTWKPPTVGLMAYSGVVPNPAAVVGHDPPPDAAPPMADGATEKRTRWYAGSELGVVVADITLMEVHATGTEVAAAPTYEPGQVAAHAPNSPANCPAGQFAKALMRTAVEEATPSV